MRRGNAGPILALAVGATVMVLWPSVTSLQEIWERVHDYEYGYLVAAISVAWLGVIARRQWAVAAQPSLAGAGLLAMALFVWLVGFNAGSQIMHQLLLPVVIWAAVLAACGPHVARRALVPVAFLYFAVPIWESLLPILQRVSVTATEAILAGLGVPAKVEEYSVTIPEGTFQIIEGCSGKRYFVVALAMAVLAAHLNHLQRWRLVGFVAVVGVLALVANWIRIVVVISAGHLTDMQHYLVAVEHKSLGNAIFVVLVGIVFLLARRLAPDAVPGAQGPEAGAMEELSFSSGRAALPFLLLGVLAVLLQFRSGATASPPGLAGLPLATGAWQGPLPPAPTWMPHYIGPDAERRASYRSAEGRVEVYVNVYGEQRQGRELVGYGNALLAPGAWSRSWPQQTRALESTGARLVAFEARAPDGGAWLIAYAFEVGGRVTWTEPMAQLAYGVRSIFGPVPAGMVALAAPCSTKCDAAQTLVMTFWDDMSSRILGLVPDERRDP